MPGKMNANEPPHMQGWLNIRELPPDHLDVIDQLEPSRPVFAEINKGCLRWYENEYKLVALGCVYILEKTQQISTQLNKTDYSQIPHSPTLDEGQKSPKKSNILLLCQVTTKAGNRVVEISATSTSNNNNIKVWKLVIDLHAINYAEVNSNRRAAASAGDNVEENNGEDENMLQHAYNTSQELKFQLQEQVYQLRIHLMHDPSDIVYTFLSSNNISIGHGTTQTDLNKIKNKLENIILKEQNKMFVKVLTTFHNSMSQSSQLQQQLASTTQRFLAADRHASQLMSYIDNISTLLIQCGIQPATAPVDSSNSPQPLTDQQQHDIHDIDHEYPQDESHQATLNTNSISPDRSRRTAPGNMQQSASIMNWRHRYDELKGDCLKSQELYARLQAECKRMQLQHRDGQRGQRSRIQGLKAENKQLRELSVAMRAQIILLNDQIENIQQSAVNTIKQLTSNNNSNNSQQGVEDSSEVNNDNEAMTYEDQQFIAAEEKSTDYQQQQHHQQPPVSINQPTFINDTTNNNDWPSKYSSLLQLITTNHNEVLLLTNILHGLRWPLLEQRLLANIYKHYTKQGRESMNLTKFMRFMKDFQLISSNPNTNANTNNDLPAPTSHSNINNHGSNTSSNTSHASAFLASIEGEINYGDANMIFAQASKLSDAPHTAMTNIVDGVNNSNGGVTGKGVFKVTSAKGVLEQRDIFLHVSEVQPPACAALRASYQDNLAKICNSYFENTLNTSNISNNNNNTVNDTTSTANTGSSSTLAFPQFVCALQLVALKKYSKLVLQVTGQPLGCLGGNEQRMAGRAVLELLLVKVLVVRALHYELVPWALVHLQHFLVTSDNMMPYDSGNAVTQYLSQKAGVFARLFENYTLTSQKTFLTHALLDMHNNNNSNSMNDVDSVSAQLVQQLQQVKMSFKELSRLARECSLVPFLASEPQLYNIFRESMDEKLKNGELFPRVLLSSDLEAELYQQLAHLLLHDSNNNNMNMSSKRQQSSSNNSNERFNLMLLNAISEVLLTKNNNKSQVLSSTNNNVSSSTNMENDDNAQQISIVKFVIILGSIAIQSFVDQPALLRIQQFMHLLEQHSLTASF